MTKRIFFFLLTASYCLLTACSKKIIPDKPFLSVTAFRLDSLPVSQINIPIQVNLAPLYALAEKNVDTVFTSPKYPDEWVQESCDTRYKYQFRRSPLKLKAGGNTLTLGFTGYYRIIGSTRVCVGGTAISPWTPPCRCGFDEAERRVIVSFVNAVNVLPDYKLKLSITRNEPQPLDKCEVCFWGQDITNDVLKGLKSELDLAKTTMEKTYGTVDLRPRFQQVWDQLNKVYDLYGMGWLQIHPQRMRIASLFARNDSLNILLSLSAKPVVSFEKPEELATMLPSITETGSAPGFNIFLDAVMNYDSLSVLLNRQLSGKSFDLNKGPVKKKFVFKDCVLYGVNNEKLIIKVSFAGTDEGIIYLVGKPVYDATTRQLEIINIDFDIRSKDAVLKGADWLFSKKIINEVSRYARYDLSGYMDTARAGIHQQLNREWINGVRGSGQINELKLIGIYPLAQHLIIRSNCSGNLSVKVESIQFSL